MKDLDTLLAALYVFYDDRAVPSERRGPGRRMKLSAFAMAISAAAVMTTRHERQLHYLVSRGREVGREVDLPAPTTTAAALTKDPR